MVLGSPSYNHVAIRLACTNVPNALYSLLDAASDDGRVVRPKHVEKLKIKFICKNLCILLVYLRIPSKVYRCYCTTPMRTE